VALGSVDERDFAAWRSRDGVHWRLTQHEPATPSDSFPSFSVIVRRGSALVSAGSSNQHPAVWVSRDDGNSWSRVHGTALDGNGYIADATVVGSVIALVGQSGNGIPSTTPTAWTMRDLVHVRPSRPA
jgi:photosystem II stability/assembly factor-like uncharacterized protein